MTCFKYCDKIYFSISKSLGRRSYIVSHVWNYLFSVHCMKFYFRHLMFFIFNSISCMYYIYCLAIQERNKVWMFFNRFWCFNLWLLKVWILNWCLTDIDLTSKPHTAYCWCCRVSQIRERHMLVIYITWTSPNTLKWCKSRTDNSGMDHFGLVVAYNPL